MAAPSVAAPSALTAAADDSPDADLAVLGPISEVTGGIGGNLVEETETYPG